MDKGEIHTVRFMQNLMADLAKDPHLFAATGINLGADRFAGNITRLIALERD
jgi:hypothetical protein